MPILLVQILKRSMNRNYKILATLSLMSLLGVFSACGEKQEVPAKKDVPAVQVPKDTVAVPEVEADTAAVDSAAADTVAAEAVAADTAAKPVVEPVSSSSAVASSSSMEAKSSAAESSSAAAAAPADTAKTLADTAKSVPADTAVADTTPAPVVPEDTSACAKAPVGSLCDKRDGNIYGVARIGSQIWMSENLRFETPNSWCYRNKPENCNKFGRLYQWTAAMNLDASYNSQNASTVLKKKHQGICPDGWSVPNSDDMKKLVDYVTEQNKALGFAQEEVGTSLKTKSGWDDNDEEIVGTNRYGFSAKATGYRDPNGSFAFAGEDASFWVAEESADPEHAPYWNMYFANQSFLGDYNNLKTFAYSIRCLKK